MRMIAWTASRVYTSGVRGKRRYVTIRIGAAIKIGKISIHHVARSYGAMPESTSASMTSANKTTAYRLIAAAPASSYPAARARADQDRAGPLGCRRRESSPVARARRPGGDRSGVGDAVRLAAAVRGRGGVAGGGARQDD